MGIPETKNIDSTLHFIQEPYLFIKAQSRLLRSDVFQTRLLFEKTVCMTGGDAAEIFTNEEIFCRKGAAPEFLRATLFGKRGIQTLDDEAHLHRKKLFMSIMTPQNVRHLKNIFINWLDIYAARWQSQNEVILYEELQEVLTRSVCEWAEVLLKEEEVSLRTQELASMFDAAGSVKRHLESRTARVKAENWIRDLVKEARRNESDETILSRFAYFRDLNGEPLSAQVAAVEVLNILRPVVAVSAYLVFCAHALIRNPHLSLRFGEPQFADNFVNEVRRYYPFFPSLIAKVRRHFTWKKYEFEKNTRVIFDIYGTNHDPRLWSMPSQFNPDRFRNMQSLPSHFVPQGIGDHHLHHRCPGELITIELMKAFSEYFVQSMRYSVPSQDLSLDLSRLPGVPKSHVIISRVERLRIFPDVTA